MGRTTSRRYPRASLPSKLTSTKTKTTTTAIQSASTTIPVRTSLVVAHTASDSTTSSSSSSAYESFSMVSTERRRSRTGSFRMEEMSRSEDDNDNVTNNNRYTTGTEHNHQIVRFCFLGDEYDDYDASDHNNTEDSGVEEDGTCSTSTSTTTVRLDEDPGNPIGNVINFCFDPTNARMDVDACIYECYDTNLDLAEVGVGTCYTMMDQLPEDDEDEEEEAEKDPEESKEHRSHQRINGNIVHPKERGGEQQATAAVVVDTQRDRDDTTTADSKVSTASLLSRVEEAVAATTIPKHHYYWNRPNGFFKTKIVPGSKTFLRNVISFKQRKKFASASVSVPTTEDDDTNNDNDASSISALSSFDDDNTTIHSSDNELDGVIIMGEEEEDEDEDAPPITMLSVIATAVEIATAQVADSFFSSSRTTTFSSSRQHADASSIHGENDVEKKKGTEDEDDNEDFWIDDDAMMKNDDKISSMDKDASGGSSIAGGERHDHSDGKHGKSRPQSSPHNSEEYDDTIDNSLRCTNDEVVAAKEGIAYDKITVITTATKPTATRVVEVVAAKTKRATSVGPDGLAAPAAAILISKAITTTNKITTNENIDDDFLNDNDPAVVKVEFESVLNESHLVGGNSRTSTGFSSSLSLLSIPKSIAWKKLRPFHRGTAAAIERNITTNDTKSMNGAATDARKDSNANSIIRDNRTDSGNDNDSIAVAARESQMSPSSTSTPPKKHVSRRGSIQDLRKKRLVKKTLLSLTAYSKKKRLSSTAATREKKSLKNLLVPPSLAPKSQGHDNINKVGVNGDGDKEILTTNDRNERHEMIKCSNTPVAIEINPETFDKSRKVVAKEDAARVLPTKDHSSTSAMGLHEWFCGVDSNGMRDKTIVNNSCEGQGKCGDGKSNLDSNNSVNDSSTRNNTCTLLRTVRDKISDEHNGEHDSGSDTVSIPTKEAGDENDNDDANSRDDWIMHEDELLTQSFDDETGEEAYTVENESEARKYDENSLEQDAVDEKETGKDINIIRQRSFRVAQQRLSKSIRRSITASTANRKVSKKSNTNVMIKAINVDIKNKNHGNFSIETKLLGEDRCDTDAITDENTNNIHKPEERDATLEARTTITQIIQSERGSLANSGIAFAKAKNFWKLQEQPQQSFQQPKKAGVAVLNTGNGKVCNDDNNKSHKKEEDTSSEIRDVKKIKGSSFSSMKGRRRKVSKAKDDTYSDSTIPKTFHHHQYLYVDATNCNDKKKLLTSRIRNCNNNNNNNLFNDEHASSSLSSPVASALSFSTSKNSTFSGDYFSPSRIYGNE